MNSQEILDICKSLCILPWIHIHALPNGDIIPCCVSSYDNTFGTTKYYFNEIINSKKYKQLRKQMLSGEKPRNCQKCFNLEDQGITSLREHMNLTFKKYMPLISQTLSDGSITDFKMRYLDIRFSNLCNFKCRGCSPKLSHSWISDYQKLHPIKSLYKNNKIERIHTDSAFYHELSSQIENLEEIYFAGGEPLIMSEHYDFLNKLIQNNKTQIVLRYNTNLSVIKKDNFILKDIWPKFKQIDLAISVDDIFERGEYFRSGLNFSKLIENILILKSEVQNLKISINCTISAFNIHRIPVIHQYFLQSNIIDERGFLFNTLQTPKILRSQILPKKQKEDIQKNADTYMASLNADFNHFKQDYENQLKFMWAQDLVGLQSKFLNYNRKLDRLRNTYLLTTYPEFKDWN